MRILLASGDGMVCPMFLTEQVEADEYDMKADGLAPVCWFSKLYDHEQFMSSELFKSGCGEKFADYAHQALLGTFNKKLLNKYCKYHVTQYVWKFSDWNILS